MAGQGKGAVRAIFYALGANAGIAVAKGGAAFWTGSGAMLAETATAGALTFARPKSSSLAMGGPEGPPLRTLGTTEGPPVRTLGTVDDAS